jgi:YD repeat-containing protein
LFAANPRITLAYDPLNRLTSMVDGIGTTVYGYDAVSKLLSEDGPWPSDYMRTNNNLFDQFNVNSLNELTRKGVGPA